MLKKYHIALRGPSHQLAIAVRMCIIVPRMRIANALRRGLGLYHYNNYNYIIINSCIYDHV